MTSESVPPAYAVHLRPWMALASLFMLAAGIFMAVIAFDETYWLHPQGPFNLLFSWMPRELRIGTMLLLGGLCAAMACLMLFATVSRRPTLTFDAQGITVGMVRSRRLPWIDIARLQVNDKRVLVHRRADPQQPRRRTLVASAVKRGTTYDAAAFTAAVEDLGHANLIERG